MNECYVCHQSPIWQGQPLTLHIDHINGVSDDHRLSNLQMLCPNCHSQTKTFAGRNRNGGARIPKPAEINPNWRNNPKPQTRKVVRPSKEELEVLLWQEPTVSLAKKFGVSDKAIEKWSKYYGLTKPPRGYWAKLRSGQ